MTIKKRALKYIDKVISKSVSVAKDVLVSACESMALYSLLSVMLLSRSVTINLLKQCNIFNMVRGGWMDSSINLTEHCVSSTTIAAGSMLTVKRDEVRLPNGNLGQREYVEHPGAVIVVPMLSNGNIVLERQFRYPLKQIFVELPAGKIDGGETALIAGKRELCEETGYSAEHWTSLGVQHPCIGYSNEAIHMYFATGLTAGEYSRDADEALEIFDLPFDECMLMIQRGEITDGKTLIALLLTEKYLATQYV